jgi:hypothetical protein
MATSQPYTVACSGGLVKATNQIELLKTPGVATDLKTLKFLLRVGIDVLTVIVNLELEMQL